MDAREYTLACIGSIGGFSIAAIAIVAEFRHRWRKRELEHLERMKAYEMGRALPQDEPWFSPMRLAGLIGAVVPLGSFAVAAAATVATGFHDGIWIAPMIVGTAAAICGSILAMSSLKGGEGTADPNGIAKPDVEEDAYDVVSSRG